MNRLIISLVLMCFGMNSMAQSHEQPNAKLMFDLGSGADIVEMADGHVAGMLQGSARYVFPNKTMLSANLKYVNSQFDKRIWGILFGKETDGVDLKYNYSAGLAFLNTSEYVYHYDNYSGYSHSNIEPVNTLQFMGELNMKLYKIFSVGFYFTLGNYSQLGVLYSISLESNLKRK